MEDDTISVDPRLNRVLHVGHNATPSISYPFHARPACGNSETILAYQKRSRVGDGFFGFADHPQIKPDPFEEQQLYSAQFLNSPQKHRSFEFLEQFSDSSDASRAAAPQVFPAVVNQFSPVDFGLTPTVVVCKSPRTEKSPATSPGSTNPPLPGPPPKKMLTPSFSSSPSSFSSSGGESESDFDAVRDSPPPLSTVSRRGKRRSKKRRASARTTHLSVDKKRKRYYHTETDKKCWMCQRASGDMPRKPCEVCRKPTCPCCIGDANTCPPCYLSQGKADSVRASLSVASVGSNASAAEARPGVVL